MILTAKNYPNVKCGHYQGPLFTIEVECNDKGLKPTNEKKEVYFLVDVSSSMRDVLPTMKKTLIGLKDLDLKITLISFSDEAKVIYPSTTGDDESFEDCVNSLQANGCTNLCDALNLCFEKREKNLDMSAWIIILTDGNPTAGKGRSLEYFHSLQREKKYPKNSRVIVLGYGTDFDPNICRAIGHFVYVSSDQEIPIVTENILNEIVQSWGANGRIWIKDNEIEDIAPNGRFVGPIYEGRKFVYIAKGNVEILQIDFDNFPGPHNCFFIYSEIDSGDWWNDPMEVEISNDEAVPEEILNVFYDMMVSSVLSSLSTSKGGKINVEGIRREISTWTKPEATEAVEKILKKMLKPNRRRHAVNLASAAATAFGSQANYSPSIRSLSAVSNHNSMVCLPSSLSGAGAAAAAGPVHAIAFPSYVYSNPGPARPILASEATDGPEDMDSSGTEDSSSS